MSKIFLLPASTRLVKWIFATDDPIERGNKFLKLSYQWNGYLFDLQWKLQKSIYSKTEKINNNGRNLIFVMGFWRSGTTLLHELLSLGPSTTAPLTYQCMNPSSFLLAPSLFIKSSKNIIRPMDAVVINPLSPQEDEFVLLAKGYPSVYRMWIDPRRRETIQSALYQNIWLDKDAWFGDWKIFLEWCMQNVNKSFLVIKSPNHVFRLKAIHNKFPHARYLWVIRNPIDTWFSNRNMWQKMMHMYALWNWKLEDVDILLYTAFQEYIKTLKWALNQFNEKQMLLITFEQLTTNPAEIMKKIVEKFELGNWNEWQLLLQDKIMSIFSHPKEKFPISPELPEYSLDIINELSMIHKEIHK